MMTRRLWIAGVASLAICTTSSVLAQQAREPFVRWAELEIDLRKMAEFNAVSQDNATASLQELGVLAFHFAAEKGNPSRVRVLEIYADAGAYNAHRQSPHFQRFMQAAPSIFTTSRVVDATPILLGAQASLSAAAPHVRVAELEIDPLQLEAYKAAVTEEIEASIRLEPGVLGIYAMSLNDKPTHLRFFEIYANEAAYRQHIQSPHFKKYVEITQPMIMARKLFEMDSPSLGIKAR